MSNANVTILYRENFGCGLDVESDMPNGVYVSLTLWEHGEGVDGWYVADHYELMTVVIVNRKRTVNELQIFPWLWRDNAEMQRLAIAEFDKLVGTLEPIDDVGSQ